MDIKTKILLTLNRMHHPRSDVHSLYLPQKEGSRGLIQFETSYKTITIGLQMYIQSYTDWIIQLIKQHEQRRHINAGKNLISMIRMMIRGIH